MDLFYKRDKPLPDVYVYDKLPTALRNQFCHLISLRLPREDTVYRGARATDNFETVRKQFAMEAGYSASLGHSDYAYQDIFSFLSKSTNIPHVLSLVEMCFRAMKVKRARTSSEAFDTLNRYFLESGVGYQLDFGSGDLLRLDNQTTHQNTIRPALALLNKKEFKAANAEYLAAFAHYNKCEYDDCVTDCCKAFESTLKIICTRHRWPHKPTDTAGPLVEVYAAGSGIDPFFKQPLMLIATIRNRLGAHGAGTTPVKVPQHYAKYALDATAAAVLLLDAHAP